MKSKHTIDSLLSTIQEYLNLNKLLDVNLTIFKKNDYIDTLYDYLELTKSSLYNRTSWINDYSHQFNLNLFYVLSNDCEQPVQHIDFGKVELGKIILTLQESDFFQKTDMWAVTMVDSKYSNAHPEIYVFIM